MNAHTNFTVSHSDHNSWTCLAGPLHGLSFEKKMERLRDTYGPIIRERVLLNFQLVHVFRPEDIETVYRLEGARPRREGFRLLQKYNNKYNDGVQGIITRYVHTS